MANESNENSGGTVGRPPIHTDPKEVENLIQDYFEWIEGEEGEKEVTVGYDDESKPIKETQPYWIRRPEPPTVTGLALHLGFAHKDSLYDYKKKEGFSDPIKRAVTRIEKHHEIKVAQGDKCVGNIFVLKNFGWKDKTEIDQNLNIKSTKYEIVDGDTDS